MAVHALPAFSARRDWHRSFGLHEIAARQLIRDTLAGIGSECARDSYTLASPADVTDTLVPVLHAEPAVINLIVLGGTIRNPDGDALHFDVPQGAANQVVGRL